MRLTKAQEKERQQLAEDLEKAAKEVRSLFDAMLELLGTAADPVNDAIRVYNTKLVDAKAFVDGIAEDRRSDFDERSERWQEGDTGQEVDSWIQEWEGLDFDAVEEIAIVEPELPEEETCHAKVLRDLPDSSS